MAKSAGKQPATRTSTPKGSTRSPTKPAPAIAGRTAKAETQSMPAKKSRSR